MTIQSIDLPGNVAYPVREDGPTAATGRVAPAKPADVPPAQKTAPGSAADSAALQSAVERTNRMIQPIATDLQFSVDRGTNQTIVKVVDTATNQVIRQVPSEEMLKIAEALDKLDGLLVKSQA
jgi:flagellar protein FlaG